MKTGCWIWLMFLALLIAALVLAGGAYTIGRTAAQGLAPVL